MVHRNTTGEQTFGSYFLGTASRMGEGGGDVQEIKLCVCLLREAAVCPMPEKRHCGRDADSGPTPHPQLLLLIEFRDKLTLLFFITPLTCRPWFGSIPEESWLMKRYEKALSVVKSSLLRRLGTVRKRLEMGRLEVQIQKEKEIEEKREKEKREKEIEEKREKEKREKEKREKRKRKEEKERKKREVEHEELRLRQERGKSEEEEKERKEIQRKKEEEETKNKAASTAVETEVKEKERRKDPEVEITRRIGEILEKKKTSMPAKEYASQYGKLSENARIQAENDVLMSEGSRRNRRHKKARIE